MKLDRLFKRAEDKNVAATYVKGMLIVDAGAKYIPATCKVASGTATVTYVTIGASNAATLKSITSAAQ